MSYGGVLIYSIFITLIDWKRMAASTKTKFKAIFLYPIFTMLIAPILFIAAFKKTTWKEIPHSDIRSIKNIQTILHNENGVTCKNRVIKNTMKIYKLNYNKYNNIMQIK